MWVSEGPVPGGGGPWPLLNGGIARPGPSPDGVGGYEACWHDLIVKKEPQLKNMN